MNLHITVVLINRDTNASLSDIQVKDIGLCDNSGTLINSHYGITCDIVHNNSLRQRKTVLYRKYKNIDLAQFKTDNQRSAILNDMSSSPNEFMDRYLSGTKLLLDIHAPLIQRNIIPRQNAPWYIEYISAQYISALSAHVINRC